MANHRRNLSVPKTSEGDASKSILAPRRGVLAAVKMTTLTVVTLVILLLTTAAHAYTGRRAILYTRGEVMLAENLAWKKQDCSLGAWRLICDLWPELKLTKWFHRTTAEAMAGWPWPALMSINQLIFGDLVFANSNDDDPGKRSPKDQFHIRHVMMAWDEPETAVHASSEKGFSKTNLRPFWMPRINLAIRPPRLLTIERTSSLPDFLAGRLLSGSDTSSRSG